MVQGQPTGFPPCALADVPDAEFRSSAQRLRESENIHAALTYLISELEVTVGLFRSQAEEAEALLERLR